MNKRNEQSTPISVNHLTKSTYKARIIKDNNPPKYKYHVVNVKAEKKYGYFIVVTKIYKHEIIETIPFENCDRIELYIEGEKTPFTTVERND